MLRNIKRSRRLFQTAWPHTLKLCRRYVDSLTSLQLHLSNVHVRLLWTENVQVWFGITLTTINILANWNDAYMLLMFKLERLLAGKNWHGTTPCEISVKDNLLWLTAETKIFLKCNITAFDTSPTYNTCTALFTTYHVNLNAQGRAVEHIGIVEPASGVCVWVSSLQPASPPG